MLFFRQYRLKAWSEGGHYQLAGRDVRSFLLVRFAVRLEFRGEVQDQHCDAAMVRLLEEVL